MAEHCAQCVRILRVFAERVIMRNRFRLRVNHEFIGIAAARFAIQRRSPLAENRFQFFLRNSSNLLHGFDAHRPQRPAAVHANARCRKGRDRPRQSKPSPRSEKISRGWWRRGRSTLHIFRDAHPEKPRAGKAVPPFAAASPNESRICALRNSPRKRPRAGPAARRPPRACREARAVPAIPRKRKTHPCPRGVWTIARGPTGPQEAHAWLGTVRSPACPLAYSGHLPASTFPVDGSLQSLGGDDAGDSGEVIGDADVRPEWCIEERLDGGQAVVAEFEYEDSTGLQLGASLRDKLGVEFVAFFAAVERDLRLVIADFAHQRGGFAPADVGRIAYDQVEEK